MKFYCTNCPQKLAADEEMAGREIECPSCGQLLTVPMPADHLATAVGSGAATVSSTSCKACVATNIAGAESSMAAAVQWIADCTAAVDMLRAPPPMSLISYSLACASCTSEAPFLRDPVVRERCPQAASGLVRQAMLHSPASEAALVNCAMRWTVGNIFLGKQCNLRLGPLSRHAAIIANNIVCGAVPTPPLPGFAADEPMAAAADSLGFLRQHLAPDASHEASPVVTAGDLIVVACLNQGIAHLRRHVHSFRAPGNVVERVLPAPVWQLASLGGLAIAMLCGVAVAPGAWKILLALLATALGTAVWLLRPRQTTRPVPPPEWFGNLHTYLARSDVSSLAAAFDSCDILGHARRCFAGTPANAPPVVARLLRQLNTSPAGIGLMKWLARELALAVRRASDDGDGSGQVALRLAQIGNALLDTDHYGRGSVTAGLLLAEILFAFPERGEKAPLWAICALENDNDLPDASMPAFIAELFRAAARMQHERLTRSADEGAFLKRCDGIARELLPVDGSGGSVAQQIFLTRLLARLLKHGSAAARLPSGAPCTLASLCAGIERFVETSAEEAEDGLRAMARAESESVMRMRGFLKSIEGMLKQAPPPSHRQVHRGNNGILTPFERAAWQHLCRFCRGQGTGTVARCETDNGATAMPVSGAEPLLPNQLANLKVARPAGPRKQRRRKNS